MGAIISYVENTTLRQKMIKKIKKGKTAQKKSPKKKAPTDFFGEIIKSLNERTVLDDSHGKGVVKGNTVGRMQDFLNQSGGNKENE